ncbi:hypothetical protein PFICI_09509 [Pestalotiopsis fici W106-1]|uniref:Mitochondrial carrier n=1 Tax=Pestalotiopsis fici (strain W106-1 / CGMCC3.15140) TaxID=1229662 RepID=W3X3D5_PESFW|nr:uncharacterized protein PFICI_09509 [Pestalotiopsis fici W106-1]ETS79656.1 hypothetical protein PFICI_09509 [Pestalotiopsis fici W106-1]
MAATERNVQGHKRTPWRNLAVGAFMNVFQVTTLGQPMEVLKTHNRLRGHSLRDAVKFTWGRGGIGAFYQGLIPWAWFEALTKGSILFLTSNEVDHMSRTYLNASPVLAGVLGGISGGAAQAYLTMGLTTCMKTIEVTRPKVTTPGVAVPGTLEIFASIIRKEGIRGVNRGVNAVALRQITGWSSRIGISRLAEGPIRSFSRKSPDTKLSTAEKIVASTVGGALSCWNQPFEVVRVEMQSLKRDPSVGQAPTMATTAKHIFQSSGISGFFRGVVPRIGVAAWATICMVGLGDTVKEYVATVGPGLATGEKATI